MHSSRSRLAPPRQGQGSALLLLRRIWCNSDRNAFYPGQRTKVGTWWSTDALIWWAMLQSHPRLKLELHRPNHSYHQLIRKETRSYVMLQSVHLNQTIQSWAIHTMAHIDIASWSLCGFKILNTLAVINESYFDVWKKTGLTFY